jgi:hypothetical protein
MVKVNFCSVIENLVRRRIVVYALGVEYSWNL